MERMILMLLRGMEQSYGSPRRNSPDSNGYEIFAQPEAREDIVKIGTTIAKYVKDNDIHDVIFADRSARPAYIAAQEAYRQLYPDEQGPNIYFMNPKGFVSVEKIDEDQSLLDNLAVEADRKDDIVEWNNARTKTEILDDVRRYDFVKKQEKDGKQRRVLLFDTCIHSGDTLLPMRDILEEAGLEVHVGVTNDRGNRSGFTPDLVVMQDTFRGCYPFDRDRMVNKTLESVPAKPLSKRDPDYREKTKFGRQIRAEVRRAVREYYEEPRVDSTAVANMEQRRYEGRSPQVLVVDVDGTLYTHEGTSIYVGKNPETATQIVQKSIPVIVNTARPEWGRRDDQSLQNETNNGGIGFVPPDIVISGMGMNIEWRDRAGHLQIDRAYEERMRNHKITYTDSWIGEITRNYDPEVVSGILQERLADYTDDGLQRVWPDIPQEGLGGVRLYVDGMTNDRLQVLLSDIRGTIQGVKAVASERPESTAEHFTGWIHVVPSIAGKERAMDYVLHRLGKNIPDRIQAHVFGDTNVDIPMLAYGSASVENSRGKTKRQRSGAEVYGYAVANMTPGPRSKLERVASALEGSQSGVRANITFAEEKGPDAIFEVVDAMD